MAEHLNARLTEEMTAPFGGTPRKYNSNDTNRNTCPVNTIQFVENTETESPDGEFGNQNINAEKSSNAKNKSRDNWSLILG